MRKITRKGLIAKLDRAFSRYIRQKHANEGGWVSCVTCGKSMHKGFELESAPNKGYRLK